MAVYIRGMAMFSFGMVDYVLLYLVGYNQSETSDLMSLKRLAELNN